MGDVLVSVTLLRPDTEAQTTSAPVAGHSDRPALVHEALYLSAPMRDLRTLLHRLATTDLPVLIQGETGTGKELAARELHLASPRRGGGPLRVLNCAAISPQLIESTLFGHERGAFTGANCRRPGIFEEAHGGTVFLDEVGELSPAAQAALLRVLESGRLTRIGSNREIEVNARVISATHRDLHALASRGTFRVDLLHRLLVLSVDLPPLRSRCEEIASLARHFVALQGSSAVICPEALACLEAYDWPGNVRELRNVVAGATVLARDSSITLRELPERLSARPEQRYAPAFLESAPKTSLANQSMRTRLASLERTEACRALEQTSGNQRRAAELLGIPLRTFERRLRFWRESMTVPTTASAARRPTESVR
jgi:two-component system, NtrC family, response regulator AtoC